MAESLRNTQNFGRNSEEKIGHWSLWPEPADCPHSCTAAAADTDNFDAEIDLNSPAGSADNFLLVKNSAVAAVPPVVVDKPEHQMS